MQANQATVIADVSKVQSQLRAGELLRAEVAKRFGQKLANEVVDRALAHASVRDGKAPITDLRAVVTGELLNRVGEILVATADAAFTESEQGRITAPETPAAIDRSEVRRALA